jgi:hypothetical protein
MKRLILLFFCLCLTVMLQAQVSKTVSVTAGGLASKLTDVEKTTVTNLTVNGTIDARDFKTMRDDMPVLAVIDLAGTSISAFTGAGGTDLELISASYLTNEIPINGLRFKEGLISIAFPQNAISIAKCGFEACLDLKTVTFPTGLQKIGKRAFENCPALVITTIPSTVTSIGASAFEDCRSLVTLTLPNSIDIIDYGTFENCNNITSITIPSSVTEIGESAFEDCRKLKSVIIPSTVKYIWDYAFENCRDLTSISLPSTTKIIGKCTFKDCRKLNSIILPSVLLSIRERIFEDCYALTSITIPSSVEEFDKEVFSGCSRLTSINVPSSVTDILAETFVECSAAIIVDAANPYYSSMDGCLYNKSKTKLISCPISKTGEFTIPSTVDTIGKGAFIGCTKITSIMIPSSVKSIKGSPFENCSGSITVNGGNLNYSSVDGVLFDKVQDTLFYCPDSKSGDYTVPSTVKVIGENAFKNCTKLNIITIPSSVLIIEDNAFAGSSGNISVVAENPKFTSVDGVLFDKDQKIIIHFPITKSGSYTIPLSVSRIAGSAFEDCDKLNLVSIPESVIYIGKKAFEDCYNLATVNIPSMVDTLEARAFEDCKKITNVTIPASVSFMGNNLFQGCSEIISIYALGIKPVDLSNSFDVFYSVDKDTCLVYVEKGSKRDYQMSKQWKNFRIVDGTQSGNSAPVSKVLTLPVTVNADSVLVKWQGNDPEGNVIKYTIYVSENGSEFVKWLTTVDTEAWFEGEFGNTYSFYSVAVDVYRNSEALKTQAEATTKMEQSPTPDVTAPSSHVLSLPATVNAESVLVKWQGSDPEGSAITFAIYVSVNGAGYTVWETTSNTQATFTGSYGNTYCFYSIATDAAGNHEASKTVAEATTKMEQSTTPDVTAPTSNVLALPATVYAESVLVKWQGSDPEGSAITFAIYVSVNGAGYTVWETTSNTQSTFTGSYGNTYHFYSIATDAAGNHEASKTQAEATVKMVKPDPGETNPIATIAQKWDDVLICYNLENLFAAYQWYKDGTAISGETKQFYQESGKLGGSYYVLVTTTDGETGVSNVLDIKGSAKSVSIYPNPVIENGQFNIAVQAPLSEFENGKLTIFSITGQVISQKSKLQTLMKQNGLSQGIYLVQVRLSNGESFNEKLIVK